VANVVWVPQGADENACSDLQNTRAVDESMVKPRECLSKGQDGDTGARTLCRWTAKNIAIQKEVLEEIRVMTKQKLVNGIAIASLAIVITALSNVAFAQDAKVQGIIKGRSGNDIILQTSDTPRIVVVLTDDTQVAQAQGAFRKKNMSMAALIPGLPVQIEGTYNAQNQLVAKSIKFKGDDLKQAQAIQAGVHETAKAAAANQAELEQQAAALEAQNAALKEQQAAIDEAAKRSAANKAAIAAASARFGQMDDYYILDEVTVLFGNGKTKVDPKYIPQLTALAEKAKGYSGYMIQVKGYASADGSATLNQKLSEDRAGNVTTILIQQGHIPLTNMLAPGAMGETRQIGNDKTAEGQAENRRVVVRILQNKGIAGVQGAPAT
jgi:OmpA-OmpF porin, OOP family